MPYTDPVVAREYRRKYYSKRRKNDTEYRNSCNESARKWRAGRPEWVREANKRAVAKGRVKLLARAGYLLSRAKIRSKGRGLKVTLTREWILERLQLPCPLSGMTFDLQASRGTLSPSIDRIDSRLGYVPDNCRVIVLALNIGFSDWGSGAVAAIWRSFLEKAHG